MLIAWNYPHVFKQALNSTKRGETLDQALVKLMGYAPRTLAVVLAHEWGVSPEMLQAMGSTQSKLSGKEQQAAALLAKSCQVSEMLAQAAHPELYPNAGRQWDGVKQEIENILGPDALLRIEQRLRAYTQPYLGTKYKQFEKLGIFKPLAKSALEKPIPAKAEVKAVLGYDDILPEDLRAALAQLYAKIDAQHPDKRNLLVFAEKIVPAGGFEGGCIATFDFESSELMPRYRFGKCSLPDMRVSCAALQPTLNPLAEAFRTGQPVIEHDQWNANGLGYVSQVFGEIQRVGVLYLELSAGLNSRERREVLRRFFALRRALMDCLGVK
jgi:hypothetical protein